jgi:hypothetical protein
MSSKNSITNLTRRNIFDYMSMEKILWAGRLDEPDFVARVWPAANEKPSYDGRFKGALADIHQHRVNNFDWEDDWIFTDGRFNLMSCSDEQFLAFLAEVVHPVVRSDDNEAADLVAEFNKHLRADPRATHGGACVIRAAAERYELHGAACHQHAKPKAGNGPTRRTAGSLSGNPSVPHRPPGAVPPPGRTCPGALSRSPRHTAIQWGGARSPQGRGCPHPGARQCHERRETCMLPASGAQALRCPDWIHIHAGRAGHAD